MGAGEGPGGRTHEVVALDERDGADLGVDGVPADVIVEVCAQGAGCVSDRGDSGRCLGRAHCSRCGRIACSRWCRRCAGRVLRDKA